MGGAEPLPLFMMSYCVRYSSPALYSWDSRRYPAAEAAFWAISSGVRGRRTLAGAPMTMEPSGITAP